MPTNQKNGIKLRYLISETLFSDRVNILHHFLETLYTNIEGKNILLVKGFMSVCMIFDTKDGIYKYLVENYAWRYLQHIWTKLSSFDTVKLLYLTIDPLTTRLTSLAISLKRNWIDSEIPILVKIPRITSSTDQESLSTIQSVTQVVGVNKRVPKDH